MHAQKRRRLDAVTAPSQAVKGDVILVLSNFASHHCAFLEPLKWSGTFLKCVWYAGDYEGSPNTNVYGFVLSKQFMLDTLRTHGTNNNCIYLQPEQFTHSTTHSEQNPVVFSEPLELEEDALLFYTRVKPKTHGYFQPATSCIMMARYTNVLLESTTDARPVLPISDENKAYSEKGLWTRHSAFITRHGTYVLPAYSERSGRSISVILYSKNKGLTWRAREMRAEQNESRVQMCVVPNNDGDGYVAFARSRQGDRVYRATSEDGIAYTNFVATMLPNNNSGIAVLRVRNYLVLAYNPTAHFDTPKKVHVVVGQRGGIKVSTEQRKWKCAQRYPLCVAVSEDDGITWSPPKCVHGDNASIPQPPTNCDKKIHSKEVPEYSYPSLAYTHEDDTIHLVYTYDRKCIAYTFFNLAWALQ